LSVFYWFGDFFLKKDGVFRKKDGKPRYNRIALVLVYVGLLAFSLVTGSVLGYIVAVVVPLGMLETLRKNSLVRGLVKEHTFRNADGTLRRGRVTLLIAYLALVVYSVVVGSVPDFIIVTIILVGMFETRRREKQRAYKAKLIAKARREGLTKRPKYLGPYLLPDEGKVRWEDTKDPIVVLPWKIVIVVAAVVLLAGIAFSIATLNAAPFLICFVISVGAAGFAGWKILVWWCEWRAITSGKNGRLIVITGVISKKVAYVKITDIKTASYKQPAGRAVAGIDAKDFVVDSPAQDDQVKAIPFVRGRDVVRVSEYLNE